MKGIVKITVTDKDGKVKTITQENKIFDLPKELIKLFISHADLGPLGRNVYNNYGNITSFSSGSPFANITSYAEWFRAIKINDVECSTTDFKDWKFPILTGGESSAQNASNKRYAYIDIENSQKAGTTMKKVYSWYDCPAFRLRSINLCHASNCKEFQYAKGIFTHITTDGTNNQNTLRNKGIYYFSGTNCCRDADYWGNSYYSQLGTTTGFSWDNPSAGTSYAYNDQGSQKFNLLQCGYNYIAGGSQLLKTAQIYALKDDENNGKEVLVFRNSDDMTTNNTDSYWKYIKVLDADNGTVKRSFSYSQFSGISSSSSGAVIYYCNVIATDFGTFLIQSTAYNSGNTKIWKIPETQTSETIELYATVSETSFRGGNFFIVVNEYILDMYHYKAIKINNDVSNPYTYYDYFPFNYASGAVQNGSYQWNGYFNKYYDIVATNYANFETWYNTTVLNLATPIDVTAGATLKIEYTIVASNE